jgi:hypothetical protein
MEVSGQLHAPATLPSGKDTLVPIEEEAGWAPGLVWMLLLWGREISYPYQELKPGCPACRPSLYQLNYPSSYIEYINSNKYYCLPVSRRYSPGKHTSHMYVMLPTGSTALSSAYYALQFFLHIILNDYKLKRLAQNNHTRNSQCWSLSLQFLVKVSIILFV